jgi:transcription elongation factor GreA-like protein
MSSNDKKNFSSANDYATDLIHLGIVYNKLNEKSKSTELWVQAIEIIKPIHQLEPNNKYYTNTLVTALINTQNYKQAKPLIDSLKKAGFNDNEFEELLNQHGL